VKVLAPGYFARQDTRTPVQVGLIALAWNLTLNVVVVLPAHLLGFPMPHVLLATSTCVSAALNAWLLWRGLRRDGIHRPAPGWAVLMLRILLANVAMAVVLVGLAGDAAGWLEAAPLARALRLAAGIAAGAATYFLALWLAGLRIRHLRIAPLGTAA